MKRAVCNLVEHLNKILRQYTVEEVIGMIDIVSCDINISLMLYKLLLHIGNIGNCNIITLELVYMLGEDRLICIEGSLEQLVCKCRCCNDKFGFRIFCSDVVYNSLDVLNIFIGFGEGIVSAEGYYNKIVSAGIDIIFNSLCAPSAVLASDRRIMEIYLASESLFEIFNK